MIGARSACTPMRTVEVVRRGKLREEHHEFLMRTHIMKLIDRVNITIHHILLDELVGFWSAGDSRFMLHNSIISFIKRDVSLILDLEDEGNKLVLKKQATGGLLEKLFPTSDEITRVSLENKFYQLANSHDADGVLDIAKMVVVHLL